VRGRLARTVVLAAVALLAPRGARGGDDLGQELHPSNEKRWSVYAATGLQYDSNVALDPTGQPLPGQPANPADGAATLAAGGLLELLDTARWQASLQYDLYQTLHFRLQDFNLRSNRVMTTAGFAVTPVVWAGFQAGYQHYALGGAPYSGAPFVTPFASLVEGAWGLTQLVYQHAPVTYFSPPFENVRDGPTDTASLSQTVYWGSHYFTAGYEFGSVRPFSTAGNDFRERYQQASVGVGFVPGWRTTIDLVYLFRYENYPEPNSAADFRTSRQDTVSQFSVGVHRPVTANLSVGLMYYGTVDNSNIAVYQYRRNIVAAELRFAY
jgi:hypothetical protein